MQVIKIWDKFGHILSGALLFVALVGCGRGDAYILAPQHWNDTEFLVEIRPGAPTRGMNEFVVVATDIKGLPGYEYVVSIKMNTANDWNQMIQDGHSGVYRRAIAIDDPQNGVLMVQITHKKEQNKQTILSFPLARHMQ
ncbi:MAG: hypothetical protein L0Z73_08220 [Gammaproteobacteria bacterium]|nr:hypothetical protein [Gammaproteobacteria bacterium]